LGIVNRSGDGGGGGGGGGGGFSNDADLMGKEKGNFTKSGLWTKRDKTVSSVFTK